MRTSDKLRALDMLIRSADIIRPRSGSRAAKAALPFCHQPKDEISSDHDAA
jgi:hypothetical protein